ncbi:DUF2237 family protein [uncultured Hydrogenophaga sp.]|uniref:DUF2237 family protein n=1 Tax=uncultured Hydrogenophaga sp. TaxID=199683 RepID=UPI00265E0BCF|nr:DUF2237 domain-containing protein [uncultured Hydrogenophaga sp.]
MDHDALNVLGEPLQACSFDPLTGFYRDGCCHTGPEDVGTHVVCARVTAEFLAFSQAVGNDLSTPRPEWRFAGLKPGDRWCLCVRRWKEALTAGVAPPVVLEATHASTLQFVDIETLRQHAWRTSTDGSAAT